MSKSPGADRRKAGIFLLGALLALAFLIFLLGQKSALFVRTTTLYVYFEDTSGLVVGAPVRLAGLDVGTVTAIAFPEALERKEARVTLAIHDDFMKRVREDSLAFIDSKGLLGDKIVNISVGDPGTPHLPAGATLKTGYALSFESLSKDIHKAVSSFTDVADDTRAIVASVRKRGVEKDIARISASLANILQRVEEGDGLAHRLIYDAQYARHVEGILTDAKAVASKTRKAVDRVDRIVAEVEHGKGNLNTLIYGQQAEEVLAKLKGAAAEIEGVMREVREGNGLVHSLVYEEGNTNFLEELNEMAEVLNRLVKDVEAGKGTVGGLLKDPTVYEDLKSVLGNVKRNVLFKALIRYTIDEEGIREPQNAPHGTPAKE